jgi:CDP-glucose 4,6-dehydratase
MTFLLEHLGVPVVGYSLPPEKDSLFLRTMRTGAIPEVFADIRDHRALEYFIDEHKPSTIIHMAAQPLVLRSYEYPRETFDINIMGTVNLLDVAFRKDFVEVILVVTTDKVYRNDNSGRAFIESDPLAGKDPYSASKVGTESVISAWQQIAQISNGPKLVSVRAGNVIGGGDFAENRLLPDLIRGFWRQEEIVIRNSNSTRPWQHVLDPLTGYLLTLEAGLSDKKLVSINFGPTEKSLSVGEVVEIAQESWGEPTKILHEFTKNEPLESKSLGLDSNHAKQVLGWEPIWTQRDAVKSTIDWWRKTIFEESRARSNCLADIVEALQVLDTRLQEAKINSL